MTALLGVFVLAASIFATPSPLSTPALCSSGLTPVKGADSVCTADCGPFTPVSCSASSCSAVNRSCPEPGHVTCGTNTYYCPACPECTDGQFKTVTVGPTCGCEDGMSTPKDRYQCVGGQWEYQFSFCGGPFCHG
jgi:hypothetical protein